MLRPDVLLAGEAATSTQEEAGEDELLATQVARLNRKLDSVATERRRLADLYQANFIERDELLRRGKELELRCSAIEVQRKTLIDQREQLNRTGYGIELRASPKKSEPPSINWISTRNASFYVS